MPSQLWFLDRVDESFSEYQSRNRKEIERSFPNHLPMPGESEVFELTLDGDAPENHPIGMVLRLGSGEGLIPMESMNPFWFMVLHRGPVINGVQTRSFMWLSNQRLGRPKDLASVRIACEKHGKIPEGQWIE